MEVALFGSLRLRLLHFRMRDLFPTCQTLQTFGLQRNFSAIDQTSESNVQAILRIAQAAIITLADLVDQSQSFRRGKLFEDAPITGPRNVAVGTRAGAAVGNGPVNRLRSRKPRKSELRMRLGDCHGSRRFSAGMRSCLQNPQFKPAAKERFQRLEPAIA